MKLCEIVCGLHGKSNCLQIFDESLPHNISTVYTRKSVSRYYCGSTWLEIGTARQFSVKVFCIRVEENLSPHKETFPSLLEAPKCWTAAFTVAVMQRTYSNSWMGTPLLPYYDCRLARTLFLWHCWSVEAPHSLSCCWLKLFPLAFVRVPFPTGMELHLVTFA